MAHPSDERILEFCQWQSGRPDGVPKAEWRAAANAAGFADIQDGDLPRAAAVLRALAAADAQHASVLEAILVARNVQMSAQASDSFECRIYDAHCPSRTVRFQMPEGFPMAGGIYRIERLRSATPEDAARFDQLPEPPEV